MTAKKAVPWDLIFTLVSEVFRRWMAKQTSYGAGGGNKEELSDLADQLNEAVGAVKSEGPVGDSDGIIAHVQRLIVALNSGDWGEIGNVFRDIVSHL